MIPIEKKSESMYMSGLMPTSNVATWQFADLMKGPMFVFDGCQQEMKEENGHNFHR